MIRPRDRERGCRVRIGARGRWWAARSAQGRIDRSGPPQKRRRRYGSRSQRSNSRRGLRTARPQDVSATSPIAVEALPRLRRAATPSVRPTWRLRIDEESRRGYRRPACESTSTCRNSRGNAPLLPGPERRATQLPVATRRRCRVRIRGSPTPRLQRSNDSIFGETMSRCVGSW